MSMHYLELAWDKIHYFHTLGKLAREFDKILVRRIFVHVIVTIFCALKLDYKAVGELILHHRLAASVVQVGAKASNEQRTLPSCSVCLQ